MPNDMCIYIVYMHVYMYIQVNVNVRIPTTTKNGVIFSITYPYNYLFCRYIHACVYMRVYLIEVLAF